MEATKVLSSEHRVIEEFLISLEKAAGRVEKGEDFKPEFFLKAAEFIQGFADGCHHKKEEGVLFTTMGQKGVAVEGGPIGVMLAEHEQGRVYTRSLRSAAAKMASANGNTEDAGEVRLALVNAAYGYVSLLRQHIFKEDNILFPLADRVIPLEEHDAILAGFETVEHEETGVGVHEKYLALAQELAREADRPREQTPVFG